jgi:hypothetical protein
MTLPVDDPTGSPHPQEASASITSVGGLQRGDSPSATPMRLASPPGGVIEREGGRVYCDPADASWFDVVREVFGAMPDAAADWLLWQATPYPLADRDQVLAALVHARDALYAWEDR